jgi:hypothetical protein
MRMSVAAAATDDTLSQLSKMFEKRHPAALWATILLLTSIDRNSGLLLFWRVLHLALEDLERLCN